MNRAPMRFLLVALCAALPILAFGVEAPAVEEAAIPLVEETVTELTACSAERAVDDFFASLNGPMFDAMEKAGFDIVNCNKPGDCPYGGYCYDDCSPCSTWRDCGLGPCTSIQLC